MVLLGDGARNHQHFLPKTVMGGPLKEEVRVASPLFLVSWKQSFQFWFGYWSCFYHLPVCKKPPVNAARLPESFSGLLWSTSAFDRCSSMLVCLHLCFPAEEAGAVQSCIWYQNKENLNRENGKWDGKTVGGAILCCSRAPTRYLQPNRSHRVRALYRALPLHTWRIWRG